MRTSCIQTFVLCLSLPRASEKCSCTSGSSLFSVSSAQAAVNIKNLCPLLSLRLFPLWRHTTLPVCHDVTCSSPPTKSGSLHWTPSAVVLHFLYSRAQMWPHKCQILGKDGHPVTNNTPGNGWPLPQVKLIFHEMSQVLFCRTASSTRLYWWIWVISPRDPHPSEQQTCPSAYRLLPSPWVVVSFCCPASIHLRITQCWFSRH